MRENGTDRDIALLILDGLNSCATLVTAVNDNLYAPHITAQPTDQTAAIGSNAVFAVTATNVAEYHWQSKNTALQYPTWADTAYGSGYDTATYTVNATEQRYAYLYRCRIVGKDGTIIYSDEVKILAPETEAEG